MAIRAPDGGRIPYSTIYFQLLTGDREFKFLMFYFMKNSIV